MKKSASLRSQEGLTLIELLVALLVGALAISIVLSLLKNAYRLSGQIKTSQESRLFVTEFINRFQDDVASAGYSKRGNFHAPIPSEPYLPLTLKSKVIKEFISDEIDQTIVYEIKQIAPSSSKAHAQEYGIFKTKQINEQDAFARTDSNQLVLAGLPTVDSFQCLGFFNPKNEALMLLECSLSIYKSNQNADTETYKIVARFENLQ
jgi:prepilin-type N-terminal cleavage/methylation domain-containing protein